MTFTYTMDPANVPLDRIRFEIGDTDDEDQLLQDEELNWCLGAADSFLSAKAMACDAVAARFHRESEIKVGQIRLGLEARAARYGELAKRLRTEAAQAHAPSLSAFTLVQRDLYADDVLMIQPAFTRTRFDSPENAR